MTTSNKRLLPLDLLRGFAVWGMLFNGNMYKSAYWWKGFSHGSWYETTIIDLVYPIFLVIIGVGVSFNFNDASRENRIVLKVLKRVPRLVLLGILLKALPYFQNFYLFGTLQCIAYALAIAVGIIHFFRNYALAFAISLNLVVFIFSITTVPWAERWEDGKTLLDQIDLLLIGHTGGVEGVITTLLASGFILFGFSARNFILNSSLLKKTVFGLLLFVLGIFLHTIPSNNFLSVPIVPRIFSLSFTSLSLGSALILYVLLEIGLQLPIRKVLTLLLMPFGINSIVAYAGVIAFKRIFFETCLIYCSDEHPRFQNWLITEIGGHYGTAAAVYLYTATILGLAWAMCLYLYQKKIFIKI